MTIQIRTLKKNMTIIQDIRIKMLHNKKNAGTTMMINESYKAMLLNDNKVKHSKDPQDHLNPQARVNLIDYICIKDY